MSSGGPICGEYGKIPGAISSVSWESSLMNWYACLSLLGVAEHRIKLLSQLCIAQANSRLLEEWWWYGCDETTRQAVVSYDASPQLDMADPVRLYKKALYDLWLLEFRIYYDIEGGVDAARPAYLIYVRQTAAEAAASHRTIWTAYGSMFGELANPDSSQITRLHPVAEARLSNHIPACIEPCRWISTLKDPNQYPYYL